MTNRRLLFYLRTTLALVAASVGAQASPATFVTALPVARDQLLIRFNMQPTFSTSSFTGVQFPVNMGYGLTSRWALFLNLNQGFGSLEQTTPQGRFNPSTGGFGDTLSYARYTMFSIDKPRSTFRIAPLAGAYFPSGSNTLEGPQGLLPKALQTGSGTVDPYFGVTVGYNNVRWGMAWDTTYRRNPVSAAGISPGDQFRSDAQFELKLYPIHVPEEGLPKLLVLSVEANYAQDSKDRVSRILAANSGGKVLKQDAILEISTLHWQVGLGAQLPVMQDLDGTGRMRERSAFYLFYEYYLAAPNWRHRKTQ
ncbi:MAG: hypothetical protein ABI165_02340 [Bryobacteraceae bacterium]